MPRPSATPFKSGDYLNVTQAHDDAIGRLAAFDDTAKVIACNSINELIDLQGGSITCRQVAVIASTVANTLRGETYGESL